MFVGFGNGPAAYNASTGDPVTVPRPGYYIDAIPPAMSVSGTYIVYGRPTGGVGPRRQWALFWKTLSGGDASGNLSAEQVQIGGNCGQY